MELRAVNFASFRADLDVTGREDTALALENIVDAIRRGVNYGGGWEFEDPSEELDFSGATPGDR